MGYHKREIKRGVYGAFSKVEEEIQELQDAHEQNNPIMVLMEMSDLLGAMEAYAKNFNLTLDDIIKMRRTTANAFADGTRTDRE